MAGLGRRTHYRKHLTDSVLYDLPEPKDDERIAKVVATRGGNQFDIILAASSDNTTTTTNNNNNNNEPGLAILPTKFHKLVWVKRNDYVIVQTGIDAAAATQGGDEDDGDDGNRNEDGNDEAGEVRKENEKGAAAAAAAAETSSKTNSDPTKTGIRFIINYILYKDQVKHLVASGLWPTHDPEFPVSRTVTTGPGERSDVTRDDDNGDDVVGGTEATTESNHNDDGIVYNEYDMDNDDDLFVNTNRIARLEIQDSDSEDSSSDDED